jgi:hypothetical protein
VSVEEMVSRVLAAAATDGIVSFNVENYNFANSIDAIYVRATLCCRRLAEEADTEKEG